MRHLLFIFVSLITSMSFAQEYTVFVKTQNSLKPFILSFNKDKNINDKYAELVQKTLEFDLINSGYLESTKAASAATFQLNCCLKSEKIDITISQFGKNRNFSYPIENSSNKSVISSVHQASDKILYELVGEYGISSLRIAYSLKDPNIFSSEIMMKYFDLHEPEQVTYDGNFKLTPIFFPNGNDQAKELLYVSYQNGIPKIFKRSIHTNDSKPLISLRGNQILPSISPNGEFLSFISDVSGTIDLFLQKLSKNLEPIGKPIQLFSSSDSVQASSSFHPQLEHIAFVSDMERRPKIFKLDLMKTVKGRKKTDVILISPSQSEATCPAFSPDGTKMAYSSLIDGVRQIFIYDFNQQVHYPLTEGPHHKENPSFAPNSLHLVYNTTCTENELYVINLHQKKPIKITQGSGFKHYPCWEQIKKRKIKDLS